MRCEAIGVCPHPATWMYTNIRYKEPITLPLCDEHDVFLRKTLEGHGVVRTRIVGDEGVEIDLLH